MNLNVNPSGRVIREHIPLEQGLRRSRTTLTHLPEDNQRAYSIRTRIKTIFFFNVNPFNYIIREHIPLEQGLRLSLTILLW